MPKVELHVHLAGSIRPKTLVALARRYDRPIPEPELESEGAWPPFRDFLHFLGDYTQVSGMVRSAGNIELVAREFMEDQAADHILYTEVTFTAYGNHFIRGIPIDDQLSALARARAWAEDRLGVTFRIILDIPRERSAEETLVMADWAIDGMDRGVVGIGLGGDELRGPSGHFEAAFTRARAAGLASVPHAGEVAGPESVWSALGDLGARRIAHGVRCMEDSALVAALRDSQVPLDVCLTSNIGLGLYSGLADHPVGAMLDAGLNVTISTDDPPMFGTTLTNEYHALCEAYGFGAQEAEELVLNGVRATLLPEAERSAMEARFRAEFKRLRALHGV